MFRKNQEEKQKANMYVCLCKLCPLLAKDKMKYVISLGADILMYPEGTLNKTENLLVQKLFPGIYDVAKCTHALVVPVAIIQEGKDIFCSLPAFLVFSI